MYACHCLNLIIESDPDYLEKVTISGVIGNVEEKRDKFFYQDLFLTRKPLNIQPKINELDQTRNVGRWTIHFCLNCNLETYARYNHKCFIQIVFTTKLADNKQIERLRTNVRYSKLFHIIINPIDNDHTIDTNKFNDETDDAVKNLKKIVSDMITKETELAEERIQRFTERQYDQLDCLRDKALKEQQILTKIIMNRNTILQPVSTKMETMNVPVNVAPIKQKSAIPTVTSASTTTPIKNRGYMRQKSMPGTKSSYGSYDAEGLFEFDGMDDDTLKSHSFLDTDTSDNDDCGRDEMPKLTRGQSAHANLVAKSLPMNIPTFMRQDKNYNMSDEFDDSPREETLDIAASIKELTRSVHGDEVFGDLPRPRFTTQI